MTGERNRQDAPYPVELLGLVEQVKTRGRDWIFSLGDVRRDDPAMGRGESTGLTLSILITTRDTRHDGECRACGRRVGIPGADVLPEHRDANGLICEGSGTPPRYRFVQALFLFPVPPATYDMRSWRRWLFERCPDVDLH